MTSLLRDPLYEVQKRAPSPNKDLHNFVVTQKEVTLTSLKVSLRPQHMDSHPRVIKKTHSEFLAQDSRGLQDKIREIFGRGTLEYVLNICRGQCDFLVRMPNKLKIHILSFLHEDDIERVADTCTTFHKLCNSTKFWEEIKLKKEQREASTADYSTWMASHDSKAPIPIWMLRRKYAVMSW